MSGAPRKQSMKPDPDQQLRVGVNVWVTESAAGATGLARVVAEHNDGTFDCKFIGPEAALLPHGSDGIATRVPRIELRMPNSFLPWPDTAALPAAAAAPTAAPAGAAIPDDEDDDQGVGVDLLGDGPELDMDAVRKGIAELQGDFRASRCAASWANSRACKTR